MTLFDFPSRSAAKTSFSRLVHFANFLLCGLIFLISRIFFGFTQQSLPDRCEQSFIVERLFKKI